MAPRIIAVCGATGTQGGAVVRHLSKNSDFHIRALTRNPTGDAAKKLASLPNVTVVKADLSDAETLNSAFDGAEAVYAMTNYYDPKVQEHPWEEACQGKLMADVAKKTGVRLFIWSTVPSAYQRTDGEIFTRLVENKTAVSDHLAKIDLPHVNLHLGFYFDNWV